jgi:hypothetical protein
MNKVLTLILVISTLCIAKDNFIKFEQVTKTDSVIETIYVPDTQWINKTKFIVRKVVIDTITMKIDTTYEKSSNKLIIDSIYIYNPSLQLYHYNED